MPEIDREIHRAEQALREADRLLTLAEVCRRLRTDRRTLYKLVGEGLLKGYRFPRIGYRFDPRDVDAFQQSHRF